MIEQLDKEGARSVLICTHAATMIAIGRALTGRMPEDIGEEDFGCFTCCLSRFRRRGPGREAEVVQVWDKEKADNIPFVDWKGNGVKGGWECEVNGDCSHLSSGEERGWRFSGDEAFISDPNAFNDAVNSKSTL